MNKRDLFGINEEVDIKFNRIVIFFLSVENDRISEMLLHSTNVDLRYTFNNVSWNID